MLGRVSHCVYSVSLNFYKNTQEILSPECWRAPKPDLYAKTPNQSEFDRCIFSPDYPLLEKYVLLARK